MKIITTSYTTALIIVTILTTAQARDWYFDKDSIGGTCSDAGSGTITQPFCNIFNKLWNLKWNGAAAGDTIYIRKGTYTGRLFWIKEGVLSNGTPSSPITIRPYPGEDIVFDGQNWDNLIKFAGYTNYVHDLHFMGPFEAKNYAVVLESDSTESGLRTNLVFDGWSIHDGSAGFIFRQVSDVVVRNSTFYNLRGLSSGVGDNVIGVSVRGRPALHSSNILIENCVAHDINDGKGNDNGDADGFHTDQYCDNVTFRNLKAYRCAEDGIDTKAQTVIMENLIAYHNGATGIKMWGGGQNRNSNYTAKNLLTFGNTETGVKCTGAGDNVTATIDRLTSWGNGEDNVKNTTGGDTFNGCTLTVRNTILGEAGISSILWPVPRTNYSTSLHLINTNITGGGISPIGCPKLSGKYTTSQYTDGTFNTDMTQGVDCITPYGIMRGSAINPTSVNPLLVDAAPVFEWSSIATAAITSNTLTLVTEASYPWPSPTVGQYIEIDDDGVKREITAIGDATTRTIEFTPAVSSSVCGRLIDCRGVRITGWTSGTTYTNNMNLSSGSPVIDLGYKKIGVPPPQDFKIR